jgi:hypothetical protein
MKTDCFFVCSLSPRRSKTRARARVSKTGAIPLVSYATDIRENNNNSLNASSRLTRAGIAIVRYRRLVFNELTITALFSRTPDVKTHTSPRDLSTSYFNFHAYKNQVTTRKMQIKEGLHVYSEYSRMPDYIKFENIDP